MTIPTHRRQQFERRAAQLNMTVAEFVAFLDEQQKRHDDLFDCRYNHARQIQAIAKHAARNGRSWSVHQ